jgi:hypothetical protein
VVWISATKYGEGYKENNSDDAYSLAFFLGPGLPLTLGIGSPSGPNATAALLFVPLFLGPSVGGGIKVWGVGVPTATGVLAFDSDLLSPFELAATGSVLEVEDDGESLTGDGSLSSLISSLMGRGWRGRRSLDDSFNVTMREALFDFRRAFDAAVESFFGGAITSWVIMGEEVMKVGVQRLPGGSGD